MPAETKPSRPTAICRSVALASALLAGGCMAEYQGLPFPGSARQRSDQIPPPTALSTPDFDEAVALASDLKYAEAELKFRQLAAWSEGAGYRDRAAECVFWIGFCLEKQGRLPEARAQYDKVMGGYPGTSAAGMAADRLKRLATAPGPRAGP